MAASYLRREHKPAQQIGIPVQTGATSEDSPRIAPDLLRAEVANALSVAD
jgi:hypothetical protein